MPAARPWARWAVPQRCAVCLAWSPQQPCPACTARFATRRPRCRACALPLPVAVPLCGACLLHPPPHQHAVAAVDYGFPWDGLLGRWKQGGDLSLTRVFTGLMRQALGQADPERPEPDLVLSMPASDARLRERGFDQAALLARGLSARADPGLLLRWQIGRAHV